MHPVRPSGSPFTLGSRRTVIVIPARYQSTRFPGKPLADLDGRPMIEHVYRRAAATPSADAVLVATDDERVARAVERFGGLVRLTSASHESGSDRLAEVAAALDCEIIVNVQGDEPLIEAAMIEQAIAPLAADPAIMMSTLRRRIDDPAELVDPNVVKVVVDRDGFALYFSRAPIPFARDETLAHSPHAPYAPHPPLWRRAFAAGRPIAYKHIGLYVYRRECLLRFSRLEATPLERAESLEQLRALEHGIRIKTVETRYDSTGVDTPEDLERVRRILATAARV